VADKIARTPALPPMTKDLGAWVKSNNIALTRELVDIGQKIIDTNNLLTEESADIRDALAEEAANIRNETLLAYELKANKSVADGYAGLSSSALVVENPVNATAVPTANKIPLADGSGKLDGWITPIPAGCIMGYAAETAPDGWLLCRGTEVSRTTYADLFAVIGEIYGAGDSSTTFNLPDMKGRVMVGYIASQVEFDTLGETGGQRTHDLTLDEIPSHTHDVGFALGAAGGTAAKEIVSAFDDVKVTSSSGGGDAHNNLQPYITVNYIIKY
jgi:microcystin-dependent protein